MEHINEDYTLQTLCRDTHKIVNEEGKLNRLPPSRAIEDEDGYLLDVIAGPFFICYAPIAKMIELPETDYVLLSEEDVEKEYTQKNKVEA